jgi:hypothetical protein
MYERARKEIYELFMQKGIPIEVDETIDAPNFCCLKICHQPTRKGTLIVGKFTDQMLELLLTAHEFGHILHYENLSKGEAEKAYCAIFASNHLGLERISQDSKLLVIDIEKRASKYAMALLRTLNMNETVLAHARATYDGWIRGYRKKANLREIETLAS